MYAANSQLIFGVICTAICAIGLIPIGVLLILANLHGRKALDAAQSWPRTTGEIIQSQVRESANVLDENSGALYLLDVQYTYQVDGKPYTGRNVTLSDPQSYNTAAEATAISNRYLVGRQVNVYYNPQNPATAVIECRKPGNFALLIVGILSLIFAACMACASVSTLAWPYLSPQ